MRYASIQKYLSRSFHSNVNVTISLQTQLGPHFVWGSKGICFTWLLYGPKSVWVFVPWNIIRGLFASINWSFVNTNLWTPPYSPPIINHKSFQTWTKDNNKTFPTCFFFFSKEQKTNSTSPELHSHKSEVIVLCGWIFKTLLITMLSFKVFIWKIKNSRSCMQHHIWRIPAKHPTIHSIPIFDHLGLGHVTLMFTCIVSRRCSFLFGWFFWWCSSWRYPGSPYFSLYVHPLGGLTVHALLFMSL